MQVDYGEGVANHTGSESCAVHHGGVRRSVNRGACGSQGEVLLIEGTTAEATETAGEFVTSEARLKQLQSLTDAKRLGHFEVLLRSTKLAGTPLSAEIVKYRQH